MVEGKTVRVYIKGEYIMDRYLLELSLKNGLGKPSISLYLRGCDKKTKCKGCHNHEYQEKSMDDYDINTIKTSTLKLLEKSKSFFPNISLSILGGEPLTEYNRDITYEISKYIKEQCPNIPIILYSWRDLCEIPIKYVEHIDYGVLGSYDEDLHVDNILPASTNQYIYDFKNQCKLEPIKLKGEELI